MSTTANSQTLEQVAKTLLTIIVVEIVAIASQSDVVLMASGANLATTLSVFLSFAYLYRYYKNYYYIMYIRYYITNDCTNRNRGKFYNNIR